MGRASETQLQVVNPVSHMLQFKDTQTHFAKYSRYFKYFQDLKYFFNPYEP